MQKKPRVLCIGHLCHDLVNGKYQLGGAASFAGLVASKLGYGLNIMTNLGEDFEFYSIFENHKITLHSKPARHTTVFENQCRAGIRTQTLHHVASKLTKADLPPAWQPDALTGITLQGCLRQWDATGKVSPKAMDWDLLSGLDIVFLSDSDLKGYEHALVTIIQKVKIVVMTQGKDGATIYKNKQKYHFPAYPAQELDPTGAGDTFAMSFLVKYQETQNIAHATAYAHAAASLMIEKNGFNENMTPQEIEERYQQYI